ncbi:MAG TPA: phosphatase [Candidatus Aquicultor sp.]|jgi:putative hydrolase
MNTIAYTIEADLHVHTVASGHAYSTVDEITREAAKRGLKMVAITDHGPCLPGGAHRYHFWNLRIMPPELHGVRILRGIEANIINEAGEIDLPLDYLEHLDIVLAGFHPSCGYESTTAKKNTETLIRAIQNPVIDAIVHPGNMKFPIKPEPVVEVAAQAGMALELNNSSFLPASSREFAYETDEAIARFAKEQAVPIILSSDAHIYTQVGDVMYAAALAFDVGLPAEQILNTSVEAVLDYLAKRHTRH